MRQTIKRLSAIAALGTTLAHAGSAASADPEAFTPLGVSALAAAWPVAGSDGRQHLVYELQLVNASSFPFVVDAVSARAAGSTRLLRRWSGDEVGRVMSRVGTREPGPAIEPGAAALLHLTFTVRSRRALPRAIVHTLRLRNPSGRGPATVRQAAGRAPVVRKRAVDLGPPLRESGWVAADGCCTAPRHVRAPLPFGGGLHIAQRFAIDWEQLDADGRLFTGDKQNPRNWKGYGAQVLAVADGVVTAAVNDRPDQVPGGLPAGLPPDQADGNGVLLKLRDGRVVMYAHMIPGSVRVKTGQRVRKGQVIGRLGNSGNSSAPHLHMHVVDRSAFLGANGLPYAFQRFTVTGRIASTDAFDTAEETGEPAQLGTVRKGLRRHQLPLDQVIVSW